MNNEILYHFDTIEERDKAIHMFKETLVFTVDDMKILKDSPNGKYPLRFKLSDDGSYAVAIYLDEGIKEPEGNIDWEKVKKVLTIVGIGTFCYILGKHNRRYKPMKKVMSFEVPGQEYWSVAQSDAVDDFVMAWNRFCKKNKLVTVIDRKARR